MKEPLDEIRKVLAAFTDPEIEFAYNYISAILKIGYTLTEYKDCSNYSTSKYLFLKFKKLN